MNKNLIIFTHGDLGQSLIDTVGLVIQTDIEIVVISNKGLDLKGSAKLLESSLKDEDNFVLTDFPGGSCFMASKIVGKSNELFTISGVNISMIISFITKHNNNDSNELVEIIKNDGKRAINY